jgi:hypothetical protein
VAPARRCYTLGNALTGVTAITDASVQSTSGTGWKVTFSIASDQYRTFRAALESAAAPELAVVTDDFVLAFMAGVPGLKSSLGPSLAENRRGRLRPRSRSTPICLWT